MEIAVGILILINLYLIGNIMQTQSELYQSLMQIKDQLVKSAGEIVARVSALEAAMETAGMTSPAVDEAMQELKAIAQALDDLNPDPVIE